MRYDGRNFRLLHPEKTRVRDLTYEALSAYLASRDAGVTWVAYHEEGGEGPWQEIVRDLASLGWHGKATKNPRNPLSPARSPMILLEHPELPVLYLRGTRLATLAGVPYGVHFAMENVWGNMVRVIQP